MGLSLASGKGATGEASGVVTPGPGGAIQVAVPLSPDFFNRIPAQPPFSSMNSTSENWVEIVILEKARRRFATLIRTYALVARGHRFRRDGRRRAMMMRALYADESEDGVPKAEHAERCTSATPKDRTGRPTAIAAASIEVDQRCLGSYERSQTISSAIGRPTPNDPPMMNAIAKSKPSPARNSCHDMPLLLQGRCPRIHLTVVL